MVGTADLDHSRGMFWALYSPFLGQTFLTLEWSRPAREFGYRNGLCWNGHRPLRGQLIWSMWLRPYINKQHTNTKTVLKARTAIKIGVMVASADCMYKLLFFCISRLTLEWTHSLSVGTQCPLVGPGLINFGCRKNNLWNLYTAVLLSLPQGKLTTINSTQYIKTNPTDNLFYLLYL